MKKQFIGGFLFTLLLSGSAGATEYIYRDLMANTLPAHCDVESKAKQAASKPYTVDRFSKRFCQTQGYGWHLDEIKTAGNTVSALAAIMAASKNSFRKKWWLPANA